MKIVYICNEINLKSGWAVLNFHTIQQAAKSNEVIVFTLKNAKNVQIENIKVYPILSSMQDGMIKSLKVIYDKFNIKRTINIDNIDIVHILVEPLLPLVDIFKNSKKVFAIVGTYSIHPIKFGPNSKMYQKSLNSIDRVVSISEYTKSLFIKQNDFLTKKTVTIPLGVEFEYFNKMQVSKDREKAFLFVGHIKPRKGLIYSLQAFKKISDNYSDIQFKIIGAKSFSKYEQQCKDYVSKNKLENVKFLGSASDKELIDLYHSSICNILTSVNEGESFEGFGLIHLEANACGLPTIGSKDCGNESAIVDGITGFLCSQKDIDDIYSKMKLIIEDYDNDNFLKWNNNCITYAKENDWSKYFEKLIEKVYEK